MIEAILNIPKEVLEANLKDDSNENKNLGKTKIIIVFLDKDFNIVNIDKKTYDEWKYDNRISQKQMKLLNCQNHSIPPEIDVNHKQIGGTRSLFSCSPLHIKFSEKNINDLQTKKKINAFKKGLHKIKFFNDINEKIFSVLDIFFNEVYYDTEAEIIKFSIHGKECLIKITKNDYILFLITDNYVDYFLEEYNKFIESIKTSSIKGSDKEGYCFICGEHIDKGFFITKGTFEQTQTKHNQLFHKFGNKINHNPNAVLCSNCLTIVELFFNNVEKLRIKHIPIPLNLRLDDKKYKKIIFDKELRLLGKLKEIYNNNNDNPFDYVLFSYKNKIDNFSFEYILNFNYVFKINNVFNLKLNEYSKKDKVTKQTIKENLLSKSELDKEKENKSNFLSEINFFFLSKKNKTLCFYRLFYDADNLKNLDTFIKHIFLKYRNSLLNFLFKENTQFILNQISSLLIEILMIHYRNKELKGVFSNEFNGKKLLLYYYKYYQGGMIKMELEALKKFEEKLNKLIEDYTSDKELEISLENDFEASYIAGQIMYYLLHQSESSKTKLDLLGTYLISVKKVEDVKKKIIVLTLSYKHKIYLTALWKELNKKILGYKFEKEPLKDNIISFFTGFYSDNIFFTKKNKILDGGNENGE